MEKEYKWRADPLLLGQALLWASARIGSQSRTIHMRSQYFDTADGLLRRQEAALRLRRENERSVCCMKLRNENTPEGMRAHEEYECDAQSVEQGLAALPGKGAPRALCEAASAAPLELICTVDFRRCAVLLQQSNTVCELALDEGTLCREGRTAPLCEIELELIAGDEAVFHELAGELAEHLSLVPEPESKLARAMRV
ncbi:MAG: CYTH domain-containing protein [Eubacteriales bacterium]|nr:CYTH domain-containing protein [Eubacteriales bacterium]